jgi:crotonobetainyl-CoA:carnitine CoA-transferase CaiB-like acyl-CoA transferase
MEEQQDDPRFNSIEKRRDNRERVNQLVSNFTQQRTVQELVALFTLHQVPHAPILGIHEALTQPHAVAREMLVETEHKTLGKIPIVNRAIKFPGDKQAVPTAPPVLGQHTDEVLSNILKLNSEQISALRTSNIIR